MRLRFIFVLLCGATSACSSSEFSVAAGSDAGSADGATMTDTGMVEDSGVVTTDAEPPPADALTDSRPDPALDAGAGCVPISQTTPTVFVNAAAPDGGTGSAACPFRTLAQAASAPLGPSVNRIVSIRTGTYVETATIRVRPRETYKSDGSGLVKVSGNATTACASGDPCTFQLDGTAALEGILVEGGTAANGIVAAAMSGSPPLIKSTTVKNAPKDGIVVLGLGAALGPNTHADANGWSGLIVRNGKASVSGVGNTFDGNKGGYYVGSTYIPGAGIYVRAGAGLFVDGGSSASNNNASGVWFDAGGASGSNTISQLTAIGNKGSGVFVSKGWQVVFRKSYLNKNGGYGLMVSYDATTSVDLGTTGAPGGNTFGTATSRNVKAGIFLCRSTADAQIAEGNVWGACPPTQLLVANCDASPTSYVDVAYAPEVAGDGSPIATPVACGSS